MEIKLRRAPYEPGHNLRRKATFELFPGVTALVGCNGAGKSTMLRNLKEFADKKGIPVFQFDNLTEDRKSSRYMLNSTEDIFYVANMAFSSEGEKTVTRISDMASKLGRFCLRDHKDAKEIFLLFDAVGSGTSIDNIVMIKEQLFQTILDNQLPDQEIYVIVATNEYELCRDADCFDVYRCTHRKFPTYNSYKKFIMKSRELRDKLNF